MQTKIGVSKGTAEAESGLVIERRFTSVGQDPFDTEKIWDDMWQPKLIGRRGITTRAISGIDIALWDLK